MKRAHASPATLAAKRIKPNPEISAVAADSKKWRGGSQQRVTWSSQGDVPQVRVDLYKDNQLVEILAVRVANTNATTVKVPAGLTPGMYKVRVKSSSNSSVFAESASPVKIDIGAQPPQIATVAVQQDFVSTSAVPFHTGSRQRVTWSSQGDVPQVRVDLYKDNQLVEILAVRVANTNATTVKVPAGLTPGMYKVRVKSSSNSSVFAESASPVKIDIGAQPPQIATVAVQQDFVSTSAVPFHTGSRQRVTWSSQGDVPQVRVVLYKDNQLVEILDLRVANTNARTINVPVGLSFGSYTLRVVSSSNSRVFASSPAFMIDDEHRERCVRYALLLLGLPPQCRLPYAIVRQIAVAAATR